MSSQSVAHVIKRDRFYVVWLQRNAKEAAMVACRVFVQEFIIQTPAETHQKTIMK